MNKGLDTNRHMH